MKFFLYFVALLADIFLVVYIVMSGGNNASNGSLFAFAVFGIIGLILLRQMKLAARELGKNTVSSAIERHRAAKDAKEHLSEKEYARRAANPEFSKTQAQEILGQKPAGFDQVMSQFQDKSDS